MMIKDSNQSLFCNTFKDYISDLTAYRILKPNGKEVNIDIRIEERLYVTNTKLQGMERIWVGEPVTSSQLE